MGIGAGRTELIAAWNGANTGQFGANLFTPGAGSIALNVASHAERDYLELDMTGFTGRAMFPMTISGLPGRYTVRWHLADQTGTFDANDEPRLALFSNLQSGASYLGIEMQRPHGTNNAILTQEEGTSEIAISTGSLFGATTAGNNRKGTVDEYELIAESPVSTDPDFLLYGSSTSVNGRGGEAWDDALLGAYTGWNNMAPAGIGIGVRFAGTRTGTILIGDLMVLKHPLDR